MLILFLGIRPYGLPFGHGETLPPEALTSVLNTAAGSRIKNHELARGETYSPLPPHGRAFPISRPLCNRPSPERQPRVPRDRQVRARHGVPDEHLRYRR